MIDIETLLISVAGKKTLIVSDSQSGIDEMAGLLKTMGGVLAEAIEVHLRKIDSGTYIGKGKLEELKNIILAQKIEMLLVDFDLSPSQYKNIQAEVNILVLDRSGIILEIFSSHARTKEAKLQVELARLEYLMPRLTNLWSHFERQRGSGGASLKGKGMGEKQIEVDRRLVKDRMVSIRKKLNEVDSARKLHRDHRRSMLKVALVGYTNAGKSTLLNALTHSDVLVEDALFATLDATVRLLNPKSKPLILGIDTVGFIDRLPHSLVASFRSTLYEALEANLLLHVLDASHPEVERHFEVTMKVLEELGAFTAEKKIPMMVVFNKADKVTSASMLKILGAKIARELDSPTPLMVSALDQKQVDHLREQVLEFFSKGLETYEIILPFEDGKILAKLHEVSQILTKNPTEKGIFLKIKTTPEFAGKLNLEKYKI